MKHFALVTATLVIALLLTAGLPVSASTLSPSNAAAGQGNNSNLLDISNTLPNGTHDASFGQQDQSSCLAEGWATDPDDGNIDLNVRILSDGIEVAQTTASNFRSDLETANACPGGTCSFSVDLWGLISSDIDHSITEQAQDAQTGEWVNLSDTPKTLNCTQAFAFQPLIASNPTDDNIGVYGLPLGTEVTLSIDDPSTFDIDFWSVATVDYAPWGPGDPNEIKS